MRTLHKGLLPALVLLGAISESAAQPGFQPPFPNPGGISGVGGLPPMGIAGIGGLPPMGVMGISGITGLPPTGIGGISGISGQPPIGFSGISGIGGRPPTGISGFRGTGPSGISGFSGMPGPRFETVWTCGKCRREVARGNHSHPPANCPYCGVRLVNGHGPAAPGTTMPGSPLMPPAITPTIPPPITTIPPPANGLPPIIPMDPPVGGPPAPIPDSGAPVFQATPDTGTSVYLNGVRSTAYVVTPLGGDRVVEGSGSVVNLQGGYILTNWHVVSRSNGEVSVLFPMWANGRPVVEPDKYRNIPYLRGRVVASDQRVDLAIIKLLDPGRIPQGTTSVRFAGAGPLAGAKVYSIGNPGASDSMWVYTPGEVRNVYTKTWNSSENGRIVGNHSAKIIEATSPISPGDSGGPCFNDKCEQVGVTQGQLISKEAHGYSFFIDASEVKTFLARNGVACNAANDAPPAPLPGNVSPNPGSFGSSNSSTRSSSESSGRNDGESTSSGSSSGSGTGRVLLIIVATLLGLGAVGAIVFAATRGAAKPKRKRRRLRDY